MTVEELAGKSLSYDHQARYTSSNIVYFPKQFCLGGPGKESNGKSRQ